jgi:Flp pilus assembly protein TadG
MLKRFTKNRSGSAAVEFAFIAPVMLLLYYGMAELTQAMMADRRAAHVASTIGDLVAQNSRMTPAAMTDVFKVGKAIIAPFATAPLSMRITSVKADAGGNPNVVWSEASGPAFSPLTGTVVLPVGLLAANESVIMTESRYVYTSAVQQTVAAPLTLGQKYYLKPRKGKEVVWDP